MDGSRDTAYSAQGTVWTTTLEGEEIQNAMAIAQDGVYIVSDHALYRFETDEQGAPRVDWRETYDRGTSIKPGSIDQGSGATPTLLGDDLITIGPNGTAYVGVYNGLIAVRDGDDG